MSTLKMNSDILSHLRKQIIYEVSYHDNTSKREIFSDMIWHETDVISDYSCETLIYYTLLVILLISMTKNIM